MTLTVVMRRQWGKNEEARIMTHMQALGMTVIKVKRSDGNNDEMVTTMLTVLMIKKMVETMMAMCKRQQGR